MGVKLPGCGHMVSVLLSVSLPLGHGSAVKGNLTTPVTLTDILKDSGKLSRQEPGARKWFPALNNKAPYENGFPCDDDQWCSPTKQRCRLCSDLDRWCNDTGIIEKDYMACVKYCYNFLARHLPTTQCQQGPGTNVQIASTVSQTLPTSEEPEENIEACRKQTSQADSKVTFLTSALIISAIITVLTCAMCVKLYFDNRKLTENSNGHRHVGTAPAQDVRPLLSSSTSSDSSAPPTSPVQMKIPVPAVRNSTCYGRDIYCLAGISAMPPFLTTGDQTLV